MIAITQGFTGTIKLKAVIVFTRVDSASKDQVTQEASPSLDFQPGTVI
jgi:hypothetical protein